MEKQEIEYARFKEKGRDKIVFDAKTQSFKNRHVTLTYGYDAVLGRWDKISEKTELLDVSTYPTKPTKKLEFDVVLMRQATDYQTLKTLTAYFKQKFIAEVKDAESNVYLVLCNGKIFMCDVIRGTTAPLEMNYTPENIKRTFIGEPIRITEKEKDALLRDGYPLYEQILLPNGDSEFRQLV